MKSVDPTFAAKLVLASLLFFPISGCRKTETPAAPQPEEVNRLAEEDIPVLPVAAGQRWLYLVTIENPQDSRSGGQTQGKFERSRVYRGKIDPGNGKPPADCFEVSAAGAKTMREFVHIEAGEIRLLGQAEVEPGGGQKSPIWFEHPIPFFRAGLSAGDSLPMTVLKKDKNLWRGTRVIGRETVTVPAGSFNVVRLQMFGVDGRVSLRKTYWFAPGKGIIREEKIREVEGKPVMVETDELISVEAAGR